MTLEEKINSAITTAMKAREKDKLDALRAVKSSLLLLFTEKGDKNISQEAEISLLQRLVKQRKESAEMYKNQNRTELYEKEIFEATIIEAYLPAQLSEEELRSEISDIISEMGTPTIKEMGKVIGIANAKLKGKAEGKLIASIVKELLS